MNEQGNIASNSKHSNFFSYVVVHRQWKMGVCIPMKCGNQIKSKSFL